MTTFKTLDEVGPADRTLVGGKAFNCAVLRQAGVPVPDGLAVPAAAQDDEVRGLGAHSWIRALPPDARLAVRSSGLGEDSEGHSFAGVHDTQLNVDRDHLVDAVLACRKSSASAQARAYRDARSLGPGEARIGVLVQRMVPAVLSGVAFTVNPVTGADEIVVNAAPGLGEDLVSGRIDPDEFRIDKRSVSVLSVHHGASRLEGQPALTEAQIGALASLLARIEARDQSAQDVEWCHDGQQFWIVQSRPVTKATHVSNVYGTEREHLNPETEWTRANLAEVFPDMMSPQVLVAYEDLLNRAQRQFMGRLLAPDSELGPIFKSFRGRMYLNLSQMRRVAAVIGAPAADMLRSVGHSEQIRREDETAARPHIGELLRCLPDLLRLGSYTLRAKQLVRAHEENTRNLVARLSRIDPATRSDREIWTTITGWFASASEGIQIVFVMSGVLPRETALRKAARAAGFPYDRLVYPQLAAGKRSVSSQQAFDLDAVAGVARRDAAVTQYLLRDDGTFKTFRQDLAGTPFLESFERFLDRYGHRGRYESDWSLPRLHEDPAPALFAVREQLRGAPREASHAAQEADAAAAWREFVARLTAWQRLTLAPRVRSTLRLLKRQYVWREQVRSDLTHVVRHLRPLHLALADRFVERGWIAERDDYFLLTLEEIQPAIDDAKAGPALAGVARRRRTEVAAARALRMPYLMKSGELPRLLSRLHSQPADVVTFPAGELSGLCVSPGLVEAEVVVMHDPSEFALMKHGAILVAPATDPSWTPLFTLASGVIVEIGGMLSHASTVAREYGLPALANVKDATRLLKTGDRVTLDASGGRVRRADAGAIG